MFLALLNSPFLAIYHRAANL